MKTRRWMALAPVVCIVAYLASIGPMSMFLLYHGGSSGHRTWNMVYGTPLGKLPRPCRHLVNRYLSFSDRIYHDFATDD